MEPIFITLFAAITALATALELTRSKDSAAEKYSKEFVRFRCKYLLVYMLMMGAPTGPRRYLPRCCASTGASLAWVQHYEKGHRASLRRRLSAPIPELALW